MAKDPRYMSFDHQYVETVTVTDATALANGIEPAVAMPLA